MSTPLMFALASMLPAATNGVNYLPRFFPAEASVAEKQYVIYDDRCGESRPNRATLTVSQGNGILDVELDMDIDCEAPGTPRRYAMEIPRPPAGPSTPFLRVRTTAPGTSLEINEGITRKFKAVPASITGTWVAPGQSEQGLLINFDDAGNAVVAWTTYRPDGSQLWLSGVSRSSESTAGDFSVELNDTGRGLFAGAGDAGDSRVWGRLELQYRDCGKLHASWVPEIDTAVAPGQADFIQLTGSQATSCHLARNALEDGVKLEMIDVDLHSVSPTSDIR